jgi:F-type H+-transporting ATPase subunit gamma
LGLCGAFNINLCKYLLSKINKDDEFVVIGKKGYSYLKSKGYEKQILINVEVSDKNMNYLEILPTTELVLGAINDGRYQSVHLVYSKFINSLTFEPTSMQLLPLDYTLFKQTDKDNKPINLNISITEDKKVIEYEPNKIEILKSCISIYTTTLVFAAIAEAKVCENAARRNAMETASDNAKQLIEDLTVQYNRARQETITQEINEIVAGAGNF